MWAKLPKKLLLSGNLVAAGGIDEDKSLGIILGRESKPGSEDKVNSHLMGGYKGNLLIQFSSEGAKKWSWWWSRSDLAFLWISQHYYVIGGGEGEKTECNAVPMKIPNWNTTQTGKLSKSRIIIWLEGFCVVNWGRGGRGRVFRWITSRNESMSCLLIN